MARKARVREGDLLAIPYAPGRVGTGIVLHVSQTLLNRSMLVGFYDRCFASAAAVDPAALGGPFIMRPQYVIRRMLDDGWAIVGHSEELLAAAAIPELRMVADLYYKDRFIRKLAPEEWATHPPVLVLGIGSVESTLQDHFRDR